MKKKILPEINISNKKILKKIKYKNSSESNYFIANYI